MLFLPPPHLPLPREQSTKRHSFSINTHRCELSQSTIPNGFSHLHNQNLTQNKDIAHFQHQK